MAYNSRMQIHRLPEIHTGIPAVVAAEPDAVVFAGRQFGVGWGRDRIARESTGLSVLSQIGATAAYELAEATGCPLIITGNDAGVAAPGQAA